MRKKIDIAKEYGEQIASNMFYDFYNNPQYCGENFTWLKFADRITNFVEIYIERDLQWPENEEPLSECQKVACTAAKKCVLNLIKKHNL